LNKTFTTKKVDFSLIKKNCKKFYVMNADNDPYVSLEKGKDLAKNLNTPLLVIENGGHLNKESGYVTFAFLLELVKKEIKNYTAVKKM